MCARYYIDDNLYDEIDRFTDKPYAGERRTGEIRPSEQAPVVFAEGNTLLMDALSWGYPSKDKGLIINARSETASEKPMFAEGMLHGRCLIPATGFYEWDKEKNKVGFTLSEERILFLAGISELFDGQRRFTILTTAPNVSMRPVHDRMPLIIGKEKVRDWLLTDRYRELLHDPMPELSVHRNYEQMSLF